VSFKISVCLISGFIKRWALGSSTSQSNSCTFPLNDTARLVAMGVLPVPPFGWQYRYHNTYPRVMVAPHLGHFRSKQGVPIWWGTRSPQLGQTQSPPGPAAKPPDLPRPPPPRPMPLPVPGPSPLGPVPSPRGILLSSLFSVFRIVPVTFSG